MGDLAFATKIFLTGIVGVFLVMIVLQISIFLTGKVIKALEKPKEKQQISNGG